MNTHPLQLPFALAHSEWRNQNLWWVINGQEISDNDLRKWCHENLEYPWRFVDVVRAYHVNAWAHHNLPAEERAVTGKRWAELLNKM